MDAVERHEVVGEAVRRAVKSALSSLEQDMTCTSKVLAIGELREALRLIDAEAPDAP